MVSPLLKRLTVSSENAENVVNPPSTPVNRKNPIDVVIIPASLKDHSNPIRKDPQAFTVNVPAGNADGPNAAVMAEDSRYLQTLPAPPPTAM